MAEAKTASELKVEFQVYVIVDAHGNIWSGVVEEEGLSVQAYNLKDAQGNDLYFESEAYHLKVWAKENSLLYSMEEKSVFVKLPTKL